MIFKDRAEAAERLIERLADYRGRNPLVLAVPRGAVPMGRIIAEALEGELDVVLVHKLGAPGNPEYAIGAVDEAGEITVSDAARRLGIGEDYIGQERERQLAALRERRARYTPVRPPIDPSGRIVIVVDDGIATGATLESALTAVRRKGPQTLVAATAVAPPGAVDRLRGVADEVVCLETPAGFHAVGQFFERFEQVDDDEVVRVLRSAAPGS